MWDEHLAPRFRDYAPRVVQRDDHFVFVCHDRAGFRIAGRAESVGAPGQTPHKSDEPVVARGGSEPGPRLEDMAIDRIGAAALYPTYGLMIQGVTEREPAMALCRAVNDWLAEYCAYDPSRLLGVGTLPMTARRRRARRGAPLRRGARVPRPCGAAPSTSRTLPRLQDDDYEPLWSYLEDADIAFAIHPGMSGLVPYDELHARYDDYFTALHATHFVMEHLLALTTFIAYGILERHPGLRVAFLESGAVWALSYLHRLDEHLDLFGFERGHLSLRPSEYFRRQCFVSVEDVEPGPGHDARPVSRLGGVRVRLPPCRRDVPRLDPVAARDHRPRRRSCSATSCATTRGGSTGSARTVERHRDRAGPDPEGWACSTPSSGCAPPACTSSARCRGPVLDRILRAATFACSSGNTQPWELVVVTDPRLKRRLQAMMTDAFADHRRPTGPGARPARRRRRAARHRSRRDRPHRRGRRHRLGVLEPRPRHPDAGRVRREPRRDAATNPPHPRRARLEPLPRVPEHDARRARPRASRRCSRPSSA